MASPNDSIHQSRKYRAFVDGLRAVAILTVVGSHTGVPGFAGGFVGVDIFFVISGYLIINHIIEDIEAKRFGILTFFMRRTLRILPAFLLVMVVTLLLATTVFMQPEQKDFAESYFLSSIMFANHHFLAHQGYFDMSAFTKPLLHMWTLAVEEQFYFLAPLTLLGLTAATAGMTPDRRSRAWIGATVALGIASFAACVAFTYPPVRSNVSFYIMPTRGWEFILGGAVPFLASAVRRFPSWLCNCLAVVGIVAIIVAVSLFDEGTLYPSYWAAIPVLGATFIIVAGLTNPDNPVARALATWPMVTIGLWSYAWYLWHWPLISFVRTINFGQQYVPAEVGAAGLALVLAALTYRFIEFPIRAWRRRSPFRPGTIVAAGIASCLIVGTVGYFWSLRFAPLMQPQLAGLEPVKKSAGTYPPALHHGVLLGDSHALVIADPFQQYAREAGAALRTVTRAGCPQLLNVAVKDFHGRIASYCDPHFEHISFQGDEFAIISVRWNYYLGLPPSDPFYQSSVLVDAQDTDAPSDPYELLARGLSGTISRARQAGVRRILIIGPLPEFPWYPPHCVMRSIRLGADFCSIPRSTVDARRQRTMMTLRRVADTYDDVELVDPVDLFCTEKVCRPNDQSLLYFFDMTHLSPAGAERLFRSYRREFQWVLTGDDAGNKTHDVSRQ